MFAEFLLPFSKPESRSNSDIKGGAIIDHETPNKRRFAAV